MSDLDATLFGFSAKTDIETAIRDVTKTPRTVYDYKIDLDGRGFDAEDVLASLHEACEGNSYITSQAMIRALKKLGVIVHGGSSRSMTSAEKGENYDLFMQLLREKVRSLGSDR
jgi:hypothetical protein